jgi:hypothetical protein
MKNKKKIVIPIVIVAIVLVLGVIVFFALNRNKTYNPTESGFYVQEDGSIIGATIEAFDKETYSLEELTSYVEGIVGTFNEKKVGENRAYLDEEKEGDSLPVSIRSIELKNENAILMLNYVDSATYVDFNENEGVVSKLSLSTADQIQNVGKLSLTNKEGNSVKGSVLTNNDYVIQIQGKSVVECEGDIVYYSAGVTVDEDGKATVDSEESLAYIIFEK